jgi:hypothetical protein
MGYKGAKGDRGAGDKGDRGDSGQVPDGLIETLDEIKKDNKRQDKELKKVFKFLDDLVQYIDNKKNRIYI